MNLELNLRGTFKSPFPINAIYFNWKYVQQAMRYGKDQLYLIQADSPQDVGRISTAVDDMFRNSPEQTRTEAERAFDINLISMFGNVKAFILSICMAVLFATLLVLGNTIAMSIRERTREVAILKSLGFTPRFILILFVGEALTLCLAGWFTASLRCLWPALCDRSFRCRRCFCRLAQNAPHHRCRNSASCHLSRISKRRHTCSPPIND